MHDRVHSGATTWDQFLQGALDEYRGFEIIQAALVAITRVTGDYLAHLDP